MQDSEAIHTSRRAGRERGYEEEGTGRPVQEPWRRLEREPASGQRLRFPKQRSAPRLMTEKLAFDRHCTIFVTDGLTNHLSEIQYIHEDKVGPTGDSVPG